MSNERSLASDNHNGIHPKILDAIIRANEGSAHAYGDDMYTRRAADKFKETFGSSAEVFFVFNGTAANVLSLKALARPHEAVLCADCAHIANDECGAPEMFTGCKLIGLPHEHGKLTAQSLAVAKRICEENRAMAPHRVQPKVLSITQSTEFGTVYSLEETQALADFAHQNGLYLHMDGARIANAAASLGVSLKEATVAVGVDVLSFGGTKNGLFSGDAVVFFHPRLAKDFELIRKQSMQLASKMRFVSAQFEEILTDSLWKENAEHANRMAAILADGIRKIESVKITRPVQANAVFATLPEQIIPVLQKQFFFYEWDPSIHEVRLMTAFNTKESDVREFIELLRLSSIG